MSRNADAQTDACVVGCVFLALVFLSGCAVVPNHVPWRDRETVIQPEVPKVEMREPHGYLVVETDQDNSSGYAGDDSVSRARRYPFYLYDQKGNFLKMVPNDMVSRTAVLPGDYIVVGRAKGQLRRVQVRVEDGRTTTVSLADIEQAPALEERSTGTGGVDGKRP